MDYDNPQFIAAVKKSANVPLAAIADALHAIADGLQQQNAAIKEATSASKQGQHTPSFRTELHVPQSDRYKKEASDARKSIVEFWKIYLEIIGIMVVIAYTTVASFQWWEMGKATKASTDAAQIAADALDENKRQFGKMFGEIQKQTGAQLTSARAAGSAAKTAQDTLHVSERAYITDGGVQLDTAKTVLTLPLINSGHIPSGTVETSLYEATFDNTPLVPIVPLSSILERKHLITNLKSMIPGSPFSIAIPIPKVSAESLSQGKQVIIIVGSISYNDGFPDTPTQRYPVCTQTLYQTVVKQFYWVPCDATAKLPIFEAMDWTGLESTYPAK